MQGETEKSSDHVLPSTVSRQQTDQIVKLTKAESLVHGFFIEKSFERGVIDLIHKIRDNLGSDDSFLTYCEKLCKRYSRR